MAEGPEEVAAERRALVATLEAVGPDAPTAVGRWRAHDLARHVAAQDRFAGVTAYVARRIVVATRLRATDAYLDRPRVSALVDGLPRSWERCLGRLRRPPPAAIVRAPVAPITLWEHVVHHEDVRRANGRPRETSPDLTETLTWLLDYQRRRLDGRVRLVSDEGATWEPDRPPDVTLQGPALELVLWLSGRAELAEVHVEGDAAELARRLAV